jgi:phosphatidylserine/phosphatidylglycerophosphate/cardiolipin synthase-like enzyme
MVIDNEIVIIGSHNYTQAAFTMNLELSAILWPAPDAREFTYFFENLFNSHV